MNPNTLCLFLGPYRNLTSLTAVMLWLHPQCQVLNHGYRLVGGERMRWFLTAEDSERFNIFIRLLTELSTQVVDKEECSPHVLQVVQDNAGVEDAFGRLHGVPPVAMVKDPMKCLVWKESQLVMNELLAIDIQWDELFAQNSKLRFIMPFRNPMECAVSNHRQRKWIFFLGLNDNDPLLMLRAVLAEFAWFVGMEQRYPERFFHFYEDLTAETLTELQQFLGLDYHQEWVDTVLGLWKIRHPYLFSFEFVQYYLHMVRLHFGAWPEEEKRLVDYVDGGRVQKLRGRDWDRVGQYADR